MPSASVGVFTTSEAAALAALTLALKDVLQPRDANRVDIQATKLANAISTYLKSAMTAPLTTIDLSP